MSVEQQWTAPHKGGRDRASAGAIIAVVAPTIVAAVAGFAIGRTTAPKAKAPNAAVATLATTTVPGGTSKATTDADAVLQNALGLHAAGKLDEAAALYQQVLAKDPNNKFAFYNLGQIAQTKGNLDEAVTQYTKSLAQDPGYFYALYNLGLVYRDKGDRAKAIEFLQKAVTANPTHAGALYNLGTLLTADGKADQGTKLIAEAIALDPSLAPKAAG